MPRLPIDYSRTVIYKLCCLDQSINDIYIGNTTNFTKRKNDHKTCCCNENSKEYNFKVYEFIRQHGGWENWQMIQIEEYNCNNKREAEARETYWMKELKSTLNSRLSFQTAEERKQYLKEYAQKEYTKEYQKQYQQQYNQKKWQYYEKKMLYLEELQYYFFK